MVLVKEDGYCSNLLGSLWSQVENSFGTSDIILHCNESDLYVHSWVLSIACPEFNKMLETLADAGEYGIDGNPLITSLVKHDIDLSKVMSDNELTFETFKQIVRFIYTGQIELTNDFVEKIQKFAVNYQFQSLVDICELYKEKASLINVSIENDEMSQEQMNCFIEEAAKQIASENEYPSPARTAEPSGKFQCLNCNEAFADTMALSGHYIKCNLQNRDIKCETCSRTFTGDLEKALHVCFMDNSRDIAMATKCMEEIQEKSISQASNACLYCMVTCSSLTERKKHEAKHVCHECSKIFDVTEVCANHNCLPREDSKMQYNCCTCGKIYASRQCFISHLKKHRGTGGVSCPFCDKVFIHRLPLQKHLISHTEFQVARYECKVCCEQFRLKIKYYSHCIKQKHTIEEVPFKCKTCNHLFPCERDLTIHQRKHRVVKPIQCSECNKTYGSKLGLQLHMDSVHRKKFQFACKKCNKRFSQQPHLKVHQRVHTKKRDHICSFCGFALTTKANLIRHESMHSGQRSFSCLVCDGQFALSHDLKRHVDTRHSGNGTVCDICRKPFKSAKRLAKHREQHQTVQTVAMPEPILVSEVVVVSSQSEDTQQSLPEYMSVGVEL